MAKIEIVKSLFEEIEKRFKKEASEVFDLIEDTANHPYKGKELAHVGGIVIKELKYKGFRFYFITDGFTLKYANEEALIDLLLSFVRMSDKKSQQVTIEKIKHILRTIGSEGFQ
ncbi:MAG: hypothetical protein QT08_C0007G0004 [archaeon GW2011_AR17]|nr:MAG: hypothetical protein QT08_C0007G0004 [archaeon GW2011_AR17]MBS3153680.1 hypothetical protein [Candidatus Woesearchaeota archaeon]HIH15097.1 hypothetical protein [Nanoarchaeota archaeon]HIH58752.1 hypothetical protein [Nanoarchaeota archaeon]HII13659.1 hypothetical protein [Nanoarchaeota archaeon]